MFRSKVKHQLQYCTIYKKKQQEHVTCESGLNENNISNIVPHQNESLSSMENDTKSTMEVVREQHDIKTRSRQTIKQILFKTMGNASSGHTYNDINKLNYHSEQFIKRILNEIEEFTHMKEVRLSQEYVNEVKNKLVAKRNEKRAIMKQLDEVRTDLSNIYRDMKVANSRSPEKYLHLTRQEIELIEKEKLLMDAYTRIDEEEQNLFNYELSAAITDSYEKEKNHTNFIKILGFVGALIGSFLTLVAAVISHIHQQNRSDNLIKELDSRMGQQISEAFNRLKVLDSKEEQGRESWGSYIKRHTSWMYSWAWKKS